jgi:hypothetical protein
LFDLASNVCWRVAQTEGAWEAFYNQISITQIALHLNEKHICATLPRFQHTARALQCSHAEITPVKHSFYVSLWKAASTQHTSAGLLQAGSGVSSNQKGNHVSKTLLVKKPSQPQTGISAGSVSPVLRYGMPRLGCIGYTMLLHSPTMTYTVDQ